MNLAILLTPPGAAAIAVVRVSGPAVGEFLRRHFSRAARPGKPVHGELRDGDQVIDDPVVVLAPDGAWADLNLHGGPWVVRSALDLARRAGFEGVETPGVPLPDAAIDAEGVLEREVLAHLPLARTELALRTLLAQPDAWRAWVATTTGGKHETAFSGDLRHVLADPSLHHLLHPPRVAIVGTANVGKSTLANQLFAQERSITADLAGTTRDWVGEIANIDGLAVMLVDTPGLRPTDDPIERAAIERGRKQITTADLVLVVIDPTRPLEPHQAPLFAAYPDAIRVINKSDRPATWDVADLIGIPTVATTGHGLCQLREAIRRHFLRDEPFDPARPRWWTERQRRTLEMALREQAPAEAVLGMTHWPG